MPTFGDTPGGAEAQSPLYDHSQTVHSAAGNHCNCASFTACTASLEAEEKSFVMGHEPAPISTTRAN